jgi:hypothetical protein
MSEMGNSKQRVDQFLGLKNLAGHSKKSKNEKKGHSN